MKTKKIAIITLIVTLVIELVSFIIAAYNNYSFERYFFALFILNAIVVIVSVIILNRLNDVEIHNRKNLFQSNGIIIQDIKSIDKLLLKEVLKLKRELVIKDSQISLMSNFNQQGILLINGKKELIYYNNSADKLLNLNESNSDLISAKIKQENIRSQIEFSIKKGQTTTSSYNINNKNLSIRTMITSNKLDDSILVLVDDLSEKINLSNSKRDFFSYAGHELKTPITILKGYAELIHYKFVTEEEIFNVSMKMIEQTDLMSRFVDDILMLSKLETFKEESFNVIDLGVILTRVIESCKDSIQKNNIQLKHSIEHVLMQASALDIEKMFKNLIENAIKYNNHQGIIEITLKKNDDKIIFEIYNTGIGIEENERDRIFERFYRVDKVRSIHGTGLGLSIVKHIVVKYHGTLELDSVSEKYAKFKITI